MPITITIKVSMIATILTATMCAPHYYVYPAHNEPISLLLYAAAAAFSIVGAPSSDI